MTWRDYFRRADLWRRMLLDWWQSRRLCRARYGLTERRCVKARGHGGPHVSGSRSWGTDDERELRLGERATVPSPLDRRRP